MTRSVRWLIALALALGVHLWPLRPVAPASPAAPRPAVVAHMVAAPPPSTAPHTPHPPPTRQRSARAAPQGEPSPPPPRFTAPPPTVLSYEFRQGAVTTTMRLTWAPSPGHYAIALASTDTQGRTATWLRSEGEIGPTGLSPRRHLTKSPGKSEQALTVLRDTNDTEIAFSTVEQRLPAPSDVQDGLSWLPHWLGRWRATDRSLPLPVAHTDGRLGTLHLAPDPTDPWHWIGTAAAPLDDAVELWLSPEPPHWPLHWRRTTPWGQTTEWTLIAPRDTPP
jgi:hypothetical protein